MKSKLLIFIIIVSVLMAVFVTPVMAASNIVKITRPDGNEVVEKPIFSICGVCTYDETFIEFLYWDKGTEKYQPLETTDGEYTFKVGSSKLFGKNVELKYKGENHIRVVAYTKATKDDPQTKNYTIIYAAEKKSLLDNIRNWLLDKF
ncbi:hypothetical protein [Ruminiclostridium josui]|uniref:hypothetical protein n=1 Tax=Ruminiclostridium josui TaxID=1499 RepID=UPI000465A72F|nr:hypothetical protein [Ruminiclostridium josui]